MIDQVEGLKNAGAPDQRADHAEQHQHARRVRMGLVTDARDLTAAQPRQRRRQRPAADLLGDPAVAVKLRRALAQPGPAVRALGYVRADLRSAVLADDE